jgi:hypothetical protein
MVGALPSNSNAKGQVIISPWITGFRPLMDCPNTPGASAKIEASTTSTRVAFIECLLFFLGVTQQLPANRDVPRMLPRDLRLKDLLFRD